MLSLDLSFYNWELFTNYILKGLLFSIQLTVFATVGGIVFGTFLALMRLSGKPALVYPSTFYSLPYRGSYGSLLSPWPF